MKYFILFFGILLLSCNGSRKLPKREVHILGSLHSLPFENYFAVEKEFIKKNLERKGIATKDLFFVYDIFTDSEDFCNLRGVIRGPKLVDVTNGFKGLVGAYVFDSDMNYIFRVDRHTILERPVPLRAPALKMVDEAIKNDFFVFLKVVNCDMLLGYNGMQVDVFHEVDGKLIRFY